jgi:peptidoglycan/LPS O-acetylase OafA/YrhL
MNETPTNKPPFWYWIISVIALIWNGLGVDGYLGQAYNTERYRSSFTPEQLETAASAPSWTMGAFAIAVFAGALAAILLLLRKKWATNFWIISLVAVILQMGYAFSTGQAADAVMASMIIVFAFLFLWFSKKAESKGWIS